MNERSVRSSVLSFHPTFYKIWVIAKATPFSQGFVFVDTTGRATGNSAPNDVGFDRKAPSPLCVVGEKSGVSGERPVVLFSLCLCCLVWDSKTGTQKGDTKQLRGSDKLYYGM